MKNEKTMFHDSIYNVLAWEGFNPQEASKSAISIKVNGPTYDDFNILTIKKYNDGYNVDMLSYNKKQQSGDPITAYKWSNEFIGNLESTMDFLRNKKKTIREPLLKTDTLWKQ